MQPTNGLLLINLGSPQAPTAPSVRRYLAQFLSDPRVMDLPFLVRQLILRLLILPRRPQKVAPKYQAIWTAEGSPLIVSSRSLAQKVQTQLGEGWVVKLAMRYGEPDLKTALEEFHQLGLKQLVLFPLFPQYASATTGSVMQAIFEQMKRWKTIPALKSIPDFHDAPGFVQGFVTRGKKMLKPDTDQVVFSFHGLPVRHLKESDLSGQCLASVDCCHQSNGRHRGCYKAQCLFTAGQIAAQLGLTESQWSVAFQSRLGKEEWIGPSLLDRLKELAQAGQKRVLVCCPSFVADCLETLEEVALSARQEFLSYGGLSLELVPSLNEGDDWAQEVVRLTLGSLYPSLLGST